MKQETKKNPKKWLIWVIALALALLAAVAAALVIFLKPADPSIDPTEQPGNEIPTSKLYWNVDMKLYTENAEVAGFSDRPKAEDGLYHFRFLVDGKIQELTTADSQLVNYIDSMQLLGLVFDADGMIIDALDASLVATEIAKDFYVQKVSDSIITLNSAVTMNGMEIQIPLSDSVFIADLRTESVGEAVTLEVMDKVWVYGSDAATPTNVYMIERLPQAGVYYRLDSFYDKTTKTTTRKPNSKGEYSMLFSYKGKQVTLKCKNPELVLDLDIASQPEGRIFGLVFDEEGYIVDTVNLVYALRGKQACQNFNITAIDGDTYTATYMYTGSKQGQTATFKVTENTEIYSLDTDCISKTAAAKISSLKEMDKIICYTDMEGNAILIYVVRRMVDVPLYWNKTQKYETADSTESNRKPDEDGYYVFEMATGGKAVTLKTKSKALADQIDANPSRRQLMGLKVSGGIIKAYYDVLCVTGGARIDTNINIKEVTGMIVSAAYGSEFDKSYNSLMTADCGVYDVTGNYGVKYGSKTTLKKYDQATIAYNASGEIISVFIQNRYQSGTKLYSRLDRLYDFQKGETTRVPDADGYYVFEMVGPGKAQTLKTKVKEIASIIDSQSTGIVALKVSGDIIKAAYKPTAAFQFCSAVAGGQYVKSVNEDGTITTFTFKNGEKVESTTKFSISKNCKIYNHSTIVSKNRGETTKLKAGDQIRAYVGLDGNERNIVQIIVSSRKIDSPLYYHISRKYSTTTKETTRVPDENGYYVYDLVVNGEVKQFKTKDKAVATEVDYYSAAFALRVEGDIIKQAYPYSVAKNVYSYPIDSYDVTALNGRDLTTTRTNPASSLFGQVIKGKLAKNCYMNDVSWYSETLGEQVKVKLGDRIRCYANDKGEIIYIFITAINNRKAGYNGKCDHCGKNVFWQHFDGTVSKVDCHYYLTRNLSVSRRTIGTITEGEEQFETIIDLNGYRFRGTSGSFLVHSNLSIVDPSGGGTIESTNVDPAVGAFNVDKGAVANILGGTIKAPTSTAGSTVGGVLFAGEGTINVKNAALEGMPTPETLGNINLTDGLTVNFEKAKLTGCNFFSGDKLVNADVLELTAGKLVANSNGLTFKDATFNTDMIVNAGATVALEGKIQHNSVTADGIHVEQGAKLDISKLATGSKIVVYADGVFTTECDNAAALKDCFVPALPGHTIRVDGKALVYSSSIDNKPLTFAADGKTAMCPVCGKDVVWTAINTSKEAWELTAAGGHYYLAEDIVAQAAEAVTNNGGYLGLSTSSAKDVICLHLNGHNLTVNGHRAIAGAKGTLNIMGTGTVTGSRNNSATAGDAINYGDSADGATLNLLGGTFTKAATSDKSSVIYVGRNVTVNMFNGVTIDGAGVTTKEGPGGIQLNATSDKVTGNSVFNMYGGTIKNCASNVGGGSIKATANTAVNLLGGTVSGGNVIGGGTMSVAGNVVVKDGGLDLRNGTKLTLGKLIDGASILVYADGVFAEVNDKSEDFKTYFVACPGYGITVTEKALATRDMNKLDNSPLKFVEGTSDAYCPVCDKVVTWTAVDDSKEKWALSGTTGHYYLAKDLEQDNTDKVTNNGGYLGMSTKSAAEVVCLHLNGHNVTVNGHRVIPGAKGTLNIMGTGTITGSRNNSTTAGDAINFNNIADGATVNLYGGTFTKAATSNKSSVIYVGRNVTVNMYAGATIDGAGVTTNGGPGGIQLNATNNQYTGNSVFNMYGGTIKNCGSTVSGGSIKASVNTEVNLLGGTISGGDVSVGGTLLVGGKMVVSEGGLNLPEGTKLALGDLVDGASILVRAEGAFTEANEKAAQYAKYFVPAKNYKIVVENNRLVSKSTLTGVDNKPLTFAADGKTAMCPVCGKDVIWTAVNTSKEAWALSSKAGHYYLAEDIVAENTTAVTNYGGYLGINNATANDSICLHLNGHNLTVNGHRVVAGGKGTLNIMGTGTLTGSRNNNATAGDAINYSNMADGATVNLYGGTFTKAATSDKSSVIYVGRNVTVNMFNGVTIDGAGVTTNGGPAGIHLNATSNQVTGESVFNMYGGIIKNCVSSVEGAGIKATANTTVNLLGGNVSGDVSIGGTVSVGGKIVANDGGLVLPEGTKLTMEELADGASILVHAEGVFTETNANAEVYKKYFVSAPGYRINVVEKALASRDMNKLDNSPLVFAEGTNKAFCPVCEKEVTWTAINSTKEAWSLSAKNGGHYYLAEDLVQEKTTDVTRNGGYLGMSTASAADEICLHLNGHNVTVNGHRVITGAKGTLNIMGTGILTGSRNQNATSGDTIQFTNPADGATLNLYGGTFTKAATSDKPSVVYVGRNVTVNMYAGATIDGAGVTTNGGPGGVYLNATNTTVTGESVFNMYGGIIKNCASTIEGASVRATENAVINLVAGTVEGDVYSAAEQ